MHQPLFDLFGQVIVTHDEINRWLESVPRMSPDSPRAAWYVRAYDVAGKVARAKLAGEFEAITSRRRERSEFWWQRLSWR